MWWLKVDGADRKDERHCHPPQTPASPIPQDPTFPLGPARQVQRRQQEDVAQGGGPFFQRKKETTSASTAQGNRTPAQIAMPDPHPALPRTETGDPPLKRGRRPGFPPGRCRTWDFSSGEGGAQRPPPPQRVTRRSQAPKFASKLKEVGHNRGRGGLPAGRATHAVPKTAWRRL